MSLWSRILDLFVPQPPEHEYGRLGIVNHPAIVYLPSDERWYAYQQDGCGAGGPLVSASGWPSAGVVSPDSWAEEISQAIAAEGWRWERGSGWTGIPQVDPWNATGIEWHRPLAVDEYGNP